MAATKNLLAIFPTAAPTAVLAAVLAGWAFKCETQPRITERALADLAAIAVPSNLDNEQTGFFGGDEIGRLTFGFSSTYLWASMGSTTTYRTDVRFSYRVAGKAFHSDLMVPSSIAQTHASHDAAAQELAPCPVGAYV